MASASSVSGSSSAMRMVVAAWLRHDGWESMPSSHAAATDAPWKVERRDWGLRAAVKSTQPERQQRGGGTVLMAKGAGFGWLGGGKAVHVCGLL